MTVDETAPTRDGDSANDEIALELQKAVTSPVRSRFLKLIISTSSLMERIEQHTGSGAHLPDRNTFPTATVECNQDMIAF